MSGLAIVSLVLLAQVILGVVAAVVGARWLAARRARRSPAPYPSDDRADRERYPVGS